MISAMPLKALATANAKDDFESTARSDSRRLYAVALSILRNPSEAEDAVQETMLRAWRNWSALRDVDKRASWLTRICVNHCISQRRGKLSRLLRLAEPIPEIADTRQASSLDGADPDLDRAMARLTTQQRAVLTLHYHHGYTLDECAGYMGCRPGTVRSHLNRALTTLRGELGDG